MKKKLFISYSHKDAKVVKDFAFSLSLRGFDIWLDEKDLASGENYTTRIFNEIHNADVYLVFLSKESLKSTWVEAEIDFALHEKIEKKRLSVVPVLLEDVDIPVSLSNLDYVDARESVQKAVQKFASKHCSDKIEKDDVVISSVAFSMSQDTSVEVGPFCNASEEDLKNDRQRVLSELRKKSYGILMNFVSVVDFDFSSEKPKFCNGLCEESVAKTEGSTEGSFGECVTVDTVVFNPDIDKVNRLIKYRSEILDIKEITFSFSVPCPDGKTMSDFGSGCFQKIQNDYIIHSYDPVEGIRFEVCDGLYISLAFTDEVMRVKFSAKYSHQLADKLKKVSVYDFITELCK